MLENILLVLAGAAVVAAVVATIKIHLDLRQEEAETVRLLPRGRG